MSTVGERFFDQAAARRVLRVQAIETAPASPGWTADDRGGATRLAQQTAGAQASPERFIAERARHAIERMRTRGVTAPPIGGPVRPGVIWLAVACVLALGAGLVIDRIGPAHHINLLAPPLWGVVVWNLAVYLWLLVVAVLPGASLLGVRRSLLALWTPPPAVDAAETVETAAQRAAAQWAELALPAQRLRVSALLHAAAAALAAGLLLGMVLRGLVLDYRAGWQSTFLDAAAAHRVLSTLLAPASWLTGVGVPHPEALGALRIGIGQAQGEAAPWIHLYAATLALAVIVPRALLALLAAWRAHRRLRRLRLPLHEPYFQRLLLARDGRRARVRALACGWTPGTKAAAGLRTLLAGELGDNLELPAIETFAEHNPAAAAPPAALPPDLLVALFSLASTPEDEVHGRALHKLRAEAAGAPVKVIVDESAFAERFRGYPQRLEERRQAWAAFARRVGVEVVISDLGSVR